MSLRQELVDFFEQERDVQNDLGSALGTTWPVTVTDEVLSVLRRHLFEADKG